MLFPHRPRFIYGKKPSEDVIYQLRFPTILKIEAEIPSAFQERIRKQYPLFREKKADQLPLPDEVLKMLGGGFPFRGGKPAFDFISADEKWTVSLSSDFVALT